MADSAEMNIMIETGADFLLYKTIRDDQNNPVDLTGAAIASHLREFAEAADYFEFACMHNGQGGKITIIMPHETTSLIAFAKGVYDVKVVLADGFTTYTLHGDAFIREGVTKSYNGSVLFTLGIDKYENLPEVGNVDRMYLVYEDQKLYRWNGMNYVSALGALELHNEGVWDGSIAYDKYATVTNAGSSYMSLHPVPADTDIHDTYYWTKLAEAGGAENIDDEAGEGDTTKTWSADKIASEFGVLDETAHVEFLYDDPANCENASYGFGLCCVIWTENTCIVNDFGANSTPASALLSFLSSKNITKIDAVIVSHYHGDHVTPTAVSNLVNSGIDLSDCTFYLPHKNIDWSQYIGTYSTYVTYRTDIITILEGAGIPYVEPYVEGTSVDIGDFNVKFYNVDADLYSTYYPYKYYSQGSYQTDSTRYNSFSMCAMVSYYGKKVFLTGDIEYPAEENMASIAAQADVYLVSHHGRNLHESQHLCNMLACRIGVIPQYCDIDGMSTEGMLAPTSGRCRELGTLLSTLNKNVKIDINRYGVYSHPDNDIQLGICKGQILLEGQALNDIVTNGKYYTSDFGTIDALLNKPSETINRIVDLVVEELRDNDLHYCVHQKLTGYGRKSSGHTTNPVVYNRVLLNGNWSEWEREFYVGNTVQSTDCNDLKNNGIYTLVSTASNIPVAAVCMVFVYSYYNSSGLLRATQIATSNQAAVAGRKIYYRTFWETNGGGDSWTNWFMFNPDPEP